MTPTVHRFPLVREEKCRLVRWFSQALLGVCLLCTPGAAEPLRKRCDISAGPAESTLKAYADQSGREVIFSSATTGSVRTNPVVGRLGRLCCATPAGSKETTFVTRWAATSFQLLSVTVRIRFWGGG
jgi:hypothetical protein